MTTSYSMLSRIISDMFFPWLLFGPLEAAHQTTSIGGWVGKPRAAVNRDAAPRLSRGRGGRGVGPGNPSCGWSGLARGAGTPYLTATISKETRTMLVIRLVYVALLIVGTFLPWSYFYAWFAENGWSLGAMIDAWYVNDATSGLVYDLTIAALALTVWALWEGIARRDWWYLAVIPVTYGIGVSAGLPLALLLLTRKRAG
jgi:hypothetical protein